MMFLHVSTILLCFGTKIPVIVIESSIGLGINISSLSKRTCGKVNYDSYWLFIDVYLNADLRRGSLRHSSNYYIIDILKTPEMTKFHMLFRYYHENVPIA